MRTRLLILLCCFVRFQEHTGRRLAPPYTGSFTPCGSRRSPFLPATAHGLGPLQRSDARTSVSLSWYACLGLQPATAVCVPGSRSPCTSFLKWGHGLLLSTRLNAYQTYPVDLFNYRAVASPHRLIFWGDGLVPNGDTQKLASN